MTPINTVNHGPVIKGDPTKPHKLSPAEDKLVADMKKRGIDYLKKYQTKGGTDRDGKPLPVGTWEFGNYSDPMAAMGGLTLVSCDVPSDSVEVNRAAERVRLTAKDMHNTYGIAFYILFLSKLDATLDKLDPQRKVDEQIIRNLSARLIVGQLPDGSWDYENPSLSKEEEDDLYGFLKELGKKSWQEFAAANPERVSKMKPLLKELSFVIAPDKLTPQFCKRHNTRFGKQRLGNNSTTQLALLALLAAMNGHYDVMAHHPLYLSVKRFRATQIPRDAPKDGPRPGTWLYSGEEITSSLPGSPAAMTCCGLIALTIGYTLDIPRPYATVNVDPDVMRAFDALADDMTRNRGGSTYSAYVFWTIERVAVLYNKGKIGNHDWFRDGLNTFNIKEFKKPEGGWLLPGNTRQPTDTCFVLLFLHRVNLIQWQDDEQHNPFVPKPNLAGGKGPTNPEQK